MRRFTLLLLLAAGAALGVTPEAQPALRLSPDTLFFGEVPVGATVGGDWVRIESVGDAPITIKIHAAFRPFFMPFDQRYVMRAASPPKVPTRDAPIEVRPFRTGPIGSDVAVDTDERGAYVVQARVTGTAPLAPTLEPGGAWSRTLEVRNPGVTTLRAEAAPLAPWLRLAPEAVEVAPGEAAAVTASVDARGLAPGLYRDTLVYAGSPGVRWRVPVALTVTSTTAAEPAPEARAVLLPPAPNPGATAVRIRFRLQASGPVRLWIADALGREVARLADGPLARGKHAATWWPGARAAGVYSIVLDAGGERQRRAVVVAGQ